MSSSKKICLRNDSKKRQFFSHRISDDLCEDILQHLPLKRKLRLECVSKQFQITVFRRVYEFKLEEFKKSRTLQEFEVQNTVPQIWNKVIELKCESELKAIESVLKKCPNIQSIDLHYFPANNRQISKRMIQLFTKYCNHLIEFNGRLLINNEWESEEFCRKFAPKLKYFSPAEYVFDYNLFPNIESIDKYLFLGPNPTEILLQFNSVNHLKKLLISIEVNKEYLLPQVMQKFEKLTHLKLCFTTNAINEAFKDFPSHQKLLDLLIFFSVNQVFEDICDSLKQIAIKCPKLKKIVMNSKIKRVRPSNPLK